MSGKQDGNLKRTLACRATCGGLSVIPLDGNLFPLPVFSRSSREYLFGAYVELYKGSCDRDRRYTLVISKPADIGLF